MSAAPVNLVSADPHDFVSGNQLWVRGREAVCTRFDYPHVFWRWTDDAAILEASSFGLSEAIEKHRSFSCTPHIFQVEASRKRNADNTDQEGQGGAAGRKDGHLDAFDPDTSDEDEEHEARHAQLHQNNSSNQQSSNETSSNTDSHSANESDSDSSSSSSTTPSSAASASVDSGARNSLMSMFAKRPAKEIISKVTDSSSEQLINAASPASVNIEHCSRARFRIPNKITSLTLLNCEDVEVEFLSVISAVELFNCQRCTVRCTQATSTFNLENTDSCVILFPGYQSRVLFVSLKGNGTQLVATVGGNKPASEGEESEEKSNVLSEEVRFSIQEPEHQATPSPAPSANEAAADDSASSSKNQMPVQYRTVWNNASASFSTEVLERSGTIGYFNNNA